MSAVGKVQVLPGYSVAEPKKKIEVFDYSGPTAYNNTATFATSGDQFNLATGGLNMGAADNILGSVDNTGTYIVYPVPISNAGGQASAIWALHWFTLATGAEVANATDLHLSTVRLQAICL